MSERLIIENKTKLPMKDALPYAIQVVEMGRVSAEKTQYCFMTGWPDGTQVTSFKNDKSDRLVIERK